MQSITLKNIPNEIHQSLKELAKLHHRSLNNEIICCLEKYAFCSNVDTSEVLERAKFNRSRISHTFTGKDIAPAINEGRK